MQRFENKYDLLNAAYRDKGLKKGVIALLQYLVYKSNKEQCFPSVDTIAAALNVCKRTVQYNMRKLEKAGYVLRKDRWYNHQQLSNQYVFNFGVVEDVPGQQKYSDTDRDKIDHVLFNIPDKKEDSTEDDMNRMTKVQELTKIYKMPLSGREKLLLTYLFHRADQKGFLYDNPEVFMSAVGIGRRTFIKLLKKLRGKNLIKAKYAAISGKNLLFIKLTGKIYSEADNHVAHDAGNKKMRPPYQELDAAVSDSREKAFSQFVQEEVWDPDEEKEVNIQNIQFGKENLERRESFPMLLWKKIPMKWRGRIQSGLEKIRRILCL